MAKRKYRSLVAYDVQVRIADDPAGTGRSELEVLKEAVAECGGEVLDVQPRIVKVPIEDVTEPDPETETFETDPPRKDRAHPRVRSRAQLAAEAAEG